MQTQKNWIITFQGFFISRTRKETLQKKTESTGMPAYISPDNPGEDMHYQILIPIVIGTFRVGGDKTKTMKNNSTI